MQVNRNKIEKNKFILHLGNLFFNKRHIQCTQKTNSITYNWTQTHDCSYEIVKLKDISIRPILRYYT